MAVTQNFLNYDSYFITSKGSKIIVNDLNTFSVDDLDSINKSLMTVYDNSETLSMMPSCDCGEKKGRFCLGKTCKSCGTDVREVHEKLEPVLWLKTIHDDVKFINPTFWIIISKSIHRLKKDINGNDQDWLRYLCDPSYKLSCEPPSFLSGIIKDVLGNKRDYINVVKNFIINM
jgi:hypothetical protein